MRKLFLVMALMSLSVSSMWADEPQKPVKGEIIFEEIKDDEQDDQRNLSPEISGWYDSFSLCIELSHYSGDVDVNVTDATGITCISTIENVYGSDCVILDITSVPCGTYHIYITLDDGTTYYGEVTIE